MNFLGQVFTPWQKGGWLNSAGKSAGSLFHGGGGGGGAPAFNPQAAMDFGKNAYNQAVLGGIDFSKKGTQANIENQNLVTPRSSQQRQLAINEINSYIQGQIPLDVQQQINRQVAQNLGGGYNMFTGGGQAPQNFARNIGQTSLGLSQFGLSAAPTWQQLANQMVASNAVGLSAGLQATGLGNQFAENQYQSQFNQQAFNAQQQQAMFNNILGVAGLGVGAYGAINNANYLNSLAPSRQGQLATTGGLPAATGLTSESFTPTGNYQPPI